MWNEIFSNDNFTQTQIILYLLGALAWFVSYALVIRKIRKEKWVEFPAFVIAANVAWEFLWGFILDLSFGGVVLQYLWRGGFLLDVFMLYSVLRYGKSQYSMPFIRKNFYFLVIGVLVSFLFLIYYYVTRGYDLAMGFNSGMILNIIHSVGCLMLFFNHEDRNFSFWIGLFRTLGTDVFFFSYILLYRTPQHFTITMGIIVTIIDVYYLIKVVQRNREFKEAALLSA